MLKLRRKKNGVETVVLETKKGADLEEKIVLDLMETVDAKNVVETMEVAHHEDHLILNRKATAFLALEETVGNNQFINFKTKQGLLFAMYLEFITFMMKFSYEA